MAHAGGRRSGDDIRAVARATLGVPLLRLVDARLVDESDPKAGTSVVVDDAALNAVGSLHAGIMATLLEVTAYLALLPDLATTEEAATHAFSASYVRPSHAGDQLRCSATVSHRSRRLAFVGSRLERDGELIATATVTKSILSQPG